MLLSSQKAWKNAIYGRRKQQKLQAMTENHKRSNPKMKNHFSLFDPKSSELFMLDFLEAAAYRIG